MAAFVCAWRVRTHALHMRLHDNDSHVYEEMRSVRYCLRAAPHLPTRACVYADCGSDATREVVRSSSEIRCGSLAVTVVLGSAVNLMREADVCGPGKRGKPETMGG